MEGSDSRVIITGGLGLFLEPGGLPLGRRTTSIVAPSVPPLLFGSLSFCFCVVGVRLGVAAAPVLRVSSSSDSREN